MMTMTDPGYPTPATWADMLNLENSPLPTNPKNDFLFSTSDIDPDIDLLMANFPHNPSGRCAPLEWLMEIGSYCQEKNIRFFNDVAYGGLSHDKEKSRFLLEAAVKLPNLEYAEAFHYVGPGFGLNAGGAHQEFMPTLDKYIDENAIPIR